ncbi:uncharacterized protein LOC118261922 isoform X2 [Spodoptera frugiperda]|uniref:Uncharacterized protein LOC118261922 isoform X2 n=1 Tax=Spodoptera frugiperda TaxID=7108 RepID=A0A9R0E2Q5_SPOFR|nr:uncharacterized protein LOC118261922 isoform X2 [Spodoptera frugiperda]
MCDCLEEKQRKERERAQRLAARGIRGGLYGPSGGAYDGVEGGAFGEEGRFDEYGNWVPARDPPSRFTPAKILLGTAGLLLALLALFLKTADTSSSPFLHKLCFSYLAPNQDPNSAAGAGAGGGAGADGGVEIGPDGKRRYCIKKNKKKWPRESTDKDGQ